MREQLIQYVNLLFAGNIDVEEIKQEILQNTLDRYDDLIVQGKSEEAAYRLAISGIGDINEILGEADAPAPLFPAEQTSVFTKNTYDPLLNRIMRAIAIGMYIIAIIPLIVLSEIGMETFGFIGTLGIVAVATVLIILFKKESVQEPDARQEVYDTPKSALRKSINNLIRVVGLVLFFVISFATGAWYITWLIFPLAAAVNGLVNACLDLKEVSDHEI